MFLVYEEMLRSKSLEDINLIGATMSYKVTAYLRFTTFPLFFVLFRAKVADAPNFQCVVLGRTAYEKAKEGELSLLSLRKEVEKL